MCSRQQGEHTICSKFNCVFNIGIIIDVECVCMQHNLVFTCHEHVLEISEGIRLSLGNRSQGLL